MGDLRELSGTGEQEEFLLGPGEGYVDPSPVLEESVLVLVQVENDDVLVDALALVHCEHFHLLLLVPKLVLEQLS